jgi:hypothetical protein
VLVEISSEKENRRQLNNRIKSSNLFKKLIKLFFNSKISILTNGQKKNKSVSFDSFQSVFSKCFAKTEMKFDGMKITFLFFG